METKARQVFFYDPFLGQQASYFIRVRLGKVGKIASYI